MKIKALLFFRDELLKGTEIDVLRSGYPRKMSEGACHSPVSSFSWGLQSNKMSLPGTGRGKKMLIYDDQIQYVYENKRNMDKMTADESDIYDNMT